MAFALVFAQAFMAVPHNQSLMSVASLPRTRQKAARRIVSRYEFSS